MAFYAACARFMAFPKHIAMAAFPAINLPGMVAAVTKIMPLEAAIGKQMCIGLSMRGIAAIYLFRVRIRRAPA